MKAVFTASFCQRLTALLMGWALIVVVIPPAWPGEALAGPRPQPRYVVYNVGVLPGINASEGRGINLVGQTTGSSRTAFRADRRGTAGDDRTQKVFIADLGRLGGNFSAGNGINKQGTVTGESEVDDTARRVAFRKVQGIAPIENLGTLWTVQDREAQSKGLAINDAGQIVGSSTHPEMPRRTITPVEYDRRGWVHLGTPLGEDPGRGSASGINSNGDIVGHIFDGLRDEGFFKPRGQRMQVIDRLWGATRMEATAINDEQTIVGYASVPDGVRHNVVSFIKYAGLEVEQLPVPPANQMVARAINNRNVVVGEFNVNAFIYRASTLITEDLNTLIPADSGWQLNNAKGISDRGEIVGTGEVGRQRRAYVLTPKSGASAQVRSGLSGLERKDCVLARTVSISSQGADGRQSTVSTPFLDGEYQDAKLERLRLAAFLSDPDADFIRPYSGP